MAKKKVSMEDFRWMVIERLKETYMPDKTEMHLWMLVYSDEYKDLIEEEYKHYYGIEYGADNAAYTIAMLE